MLSTILDQYGAVDAPTLGYTLDFLFESSPTQKTIIDEMDPRLRASDKERNP